MINKFGEYVSVKAHIGFPKGPVPVYATIHGKRVEIGTGETDEETGAFKTKFNGTPETRELWEFLTRADKFSLPIRVSEVEADPIEGLSEDPISLDMRDLAGICQLCGFRNGIHTVRTEKIIVNGLDKFRSTGWDCPNPGS